MNLNTNDIEELSEVNLTPNIIKLIDNNDSKKYEIICVTWQTFIGIPFTIAVNI